MKSFTFSYQLIMGVFSSLILVIAAQSAEPPPSAQSPDATVPKVKAPGKPLIDEEDYQALRGQLDKLKSYLMDHVRKALTVEHQQIHGANTSGPVIAGEGFSIIRSASYAVHLLGEMRCEDAAPLLAQSLHKPFGYLRHESRLALVKIGNASVEPVLKELPAQTWSRGVLNILWVCKQILGEHELKRRLIQMKQQATSDDEKKKCDMYIELISLDLEANSAQSIQELTRTMKKYGTLSPNIPVPWRN